MTTKFWQKTFDSLSNVETFLFSIKPWKKEKLATPMLVVFLLPVKWCFSELCCAGIFLAEPRGRDQWHSDGWHAEAACFKDNTALDWNVFSVSLFSSICVIFHTANTFKCFCTVDTNGECMSCLWWNTLLLEYVFHRWGDTENQDLIPEKYFWGLNSHRCQWKLLMSLSLWV